MWPIQWPKPSRQQENDDGDGNKSEGHGRKRETNNPLLSIASIAFENRNNNNNKRVKSWVGKLCSSSLASACRRRATRSEMSPSVTPHRSYSFSHETLLYLLPFSFSVSSQWCAYGPCISFPIIFGFCAMILAWTATWGCDLFQRYVCRCCWIGRARISCLSSSCSSISSKLYLIWIFPYFVTISFEKL